MNQIPDANVIHSRLRLRQLRLMLALQDMGSLRRAADSMGITQPAATKMLHEAEDLLGVELFSRMPRGMEATPSGVTVTSCARRVFAKLSGMREDLVALESGSLGRVSVGAIPAQASSLLTRTIAEMKRTHPRLSMSIQVDSSDVLVQALLTDQLDVVLGRIPGGIHTEELLFDSLGEEELCVIAGRQHPMAHATELSWADIQDMTWVLQQHPSPLRSMINQVFHDARLEVPDSIIETTSIMTLLSLVQQTDMLGVIPISVVADYPGRDRLAILPIKFDTQLPPFGLITMRNRVQSSAMTVFMKSVKAEYSVVRT